MNLEKIEAGGNMFKKLWEIIIAITAWTAILFQAYLTTGSFGNLFSYFTILTNSLIAISITAILFLSQKSIGLFCKKPSLQTAIALYIFIVALVYNTVLRGLLTLHGWSLFVDTLLHVVVPIQYIIYWFIFTQKGTLAYKQGLNWLYFPFAYLLYSLIRGAYYGWYPYPFLNVQELGYTKVIINSVILIAVFLISGFALIGLDNMLGRRKTAT